MINANTCMVKVVSFNFYGVVLKFKDKHVQNK